MPIGQYKHNTSEVAINLEKVSHIAKYFTHIAFDGSLAKYVVNCRASVESEAIVVNDELLRNFSNQSTSSK